MLHHRTTDPAERAADVAERESDLAYRRRDPNPWTRTWLQTYFEVLEEFAGGENFAAASLTDREQ